MPNMNGYEATEKIRELGIEVPIIAVTANALRDEMSRCLEAGMNDYLAKPFKKKDLLPIMSKWLDLSPQDGAVQEEEGKEEKRKEEKSYIFDYRKAVDTFMGKEEVVRRVLNLFISKVEEQLKIIQDALGQDDFERVRAEAHSIKGSAWNLEARQLGDAAKGLEDAGRERQKQSAEYKLSEANEAFAHLKRAVSSIIA
ncbi:Sensor histidine kinase RcsC [subsurface metagenome]